MLRVTADWHLDRILLSLNQESREDPVAGESLGIPRQISVTATSEEKAGREASAVRSGPGLDTGTPGWLREHLGQGLSWDELPSQRPEGAWVSPR